MKRTAMENSNLLIETQVEHLNMDVSFSLTIPINPSKFILFS